MENTEFNLEWAKRGGVMFHKDYRFVKALNSDKFGDWILISQIYEVNPESDTVYSQNFIDLRMATREECEAAGVEYIEPPVSADELEELHKNKERIKFLFENADLAYLYATSSDSMDKFIEDIDAAMSKSTSTAEMKRENANVA